MRAITLTHLRPPSIHIGATTLAHPRHHTYASAPPHSHNLRLHRCAQAPPHSGIRATTLTHLRPPFLLSVLIRINQNLAELIRYPPRNFDRFRLISINYEDTIARTYSCTVPTPKHLLQHFHSCASSLSRNHRPHTQAPTPALPLMRVITLAQPPSPLSRIYAYATAHKRTHFQAGLRSFYRCFVPFST